MKSEFGLLEQSLARKEETWKNKLSALTSSHEQEILIMKASFEEKANRQQLVLKEESMILQQQVIDLQAKLVTAQSCFQESETSKSKQLKKFDEKLDSLQIEGKKLQGIISDLQSEKRTLNLQITTILAAHDAERVKQNEERDIKECELVQLSERIKISENAKQTVMDELTEKRYLLDNQISLVTQLQNEIKTLNVKLAEETSMRMTLKKKSVELETECHKELVSMAKGVKSSEQAKTKAEEMKSLAENKLIAIQSELAILSTTVKDRDDSITKLKEKTNEIKKDFVHLGKKYQDMETNKLAIENALKSEVERLHASLNQIEKEKALITEKNNVLEKSFVDFQNDSKKSLDELSKQTNSLIIQLEESERCRVLMSGTLKDMEIEAKIREKVAADLADQLTITKEKLNSVSNDATHRQKKRDAEWQVVLEDEKQRGAAINSKIDILHKQLIEKEDECRNLFEKLESQEKIIQYVNDEMEEMRKLHEEKQEQSKTWNDKENDLRDDLYSKIEEISILRDGFSELEKDLLKERSLKMDLSKQLEVARSKVSNTEKDMKLLVIEVEKQRAKAKEKMKQATSILLNIN